MIYFPIGGCVAFGRDDFASTHVRSEYRREYKYEADVEEKCAQLAQSQESIRRLGTALRDMR